MLQTDFLHVLSDAFQSHEGWGILNPNGTYLPTASVNNSNPGNLDFEHQAGAILSAGGRFADFQGNFVNGKQADIVQIAIDLKKFDTLTTLISSYAPPTENDTAAYIAAVVKFLASRNMVIDPNESIKAFIANFSKPMAFWVVDNLFYPAAWHSIQAAITQLCSFMPQIVVTFRYSDAPIQGNIATIQNANPPGGTYSGLIGNAAKHIILPYAMGQVLTGVIYDGTRMQGFPMPYGGCEFNAVNVAPVSAVCAAMFQGPAFTNSLACILFHEFIHGLFKITGQVDILHQYLINHGGYNANLATDLLAVYNGPQLNTLLAVQNLLSQEKKVAAMIS